jgi:23S rRNA (adenine2503-C2)-methyltransferase
MSRQVNAPASIERPVAPSADLTTTERARILAKSAMFAPPPATLPDGHRELVGLTREELAAEMVAIGEQPFRAKQLWHWIYHQGVTDFSRMPSIAKPMQAKLAERFVVGRPEATTVQTSHDGTRKFLFRYRDGQQVETVYIPSIGEDRGAVCISTQVGCTLSCTFCHTGTQKLVRNLGRRRDRRPVHGRARQLRRMAEPEGRHGAAFVQHRRHGHGRAAVQL